MSASHHLTRVEMKACCTQLQRVLSQLDISNAVVGGVACNLFNSDRHTRDIDLVLEHPANLIRQLKERIATIDPKFRSVGNSLYFEDQPFPIELLPAENFAWPKPLSSCTVSMNGITVLSPSGVLLSKSMRAGASSSSIRPITRLKFESDLSDMLYLTSIIEPDDLSTCFSHFTPEHQSKLAKNLRIVVESQNRSQDPQGDRLKMLVELLEGKLPERADHVLVSM